MFLKKIIINGKLRTLLLSKILNNTGIVFLTLFLFALLFRISALNSPDYVLVDEAYYVPASISIIESGIDPNYVHPPFGKYLIAFSIQLFGNNPLGWRFFSVIFGSFAVALLYLLGKDCFGNPVGIMAALFLAIDPMEYVMSRLAMLDIFLMFFTLIGFLLLLKKRYLPSALVFGLACGIKFIGVLSILGVTILLIYQKKYGEIPKYILLPIILVLIIYLPIIVRGGIINWFSNIIFVFSWHMTLSADHPAISNPSGWLFNVNPFPVSDGENPILISANPFLYPMVIPSSVYLFFNYLKRRNDVRYLIPILWFISTYVPFFLLPRKTQYIFYLLPSVPSILLMVSYSIYMIFLKLFDN